ncbi:MAG: 2OG-Fe(II) oxygenase [Methylomicrobium sp.]
MPWNVERANFAVIRITEAISPEVCSDLLVQAKQHTNWISLDRYDETHGQSDPDSPRRVSVSSGFRSSWQPTELFSEFSEIVKTAWGISLSKFTGYGISHYDQNSKLPLHQDTTGDDHRLVTFVLYLAVANSGGEIHFPTVELSISPRPMDIVLFPSNLPHMVTPITDGERWIVVWFGE